MTQFGPLTWWPVNFNLSAPWKSCTRFKMSSNPTFSWYLATFDSTRGLQFHIESKCFTASAAWDMKRQAQWYLSVLLRGVCPLCQCLSIWPRLSHPEPPRGLRNIVKSLNFLSVFEPMRCARFCLLDALIGRAGWFGGGRRAQDDVDP